MSIMELGALGEFVAAVAVLITLIYLTTQVRHTREESARAVLQSRAQLDQAADQPRRLAGRTTYGQILGLKCLPNAYRMSLRTRKQRRSISNYLI